jgi:hypothetical protein
MESYSNNLVLTTPRAEAHREFEIPRADSRERAMTLPEFSQDNTWRRRLSRQRRPLALSHRCGPLD